LNHNDVHFLNRGYEHIRSFSYHETELVDGTTLIAIDMHHTALSLKKQRSL